MSILHRWISALAQAPGRARPILRRARRDDSGASVVETVIIAAGLAVLALSVMAAITILVEGKVAGISL
ncbi:MAG: hypothetical protein ACRD2C_13775 [Acidimicrobiales bacterium]